MIQTGTAFAPALGSAASAVIGTGWSEAGAHFAEAAAEAALVAVLAGGRGSRPVGRRGRSGSVKGALKERGVGARLTR